MPRYRRRFCLPPLLAAALSACMPAERYSKLHEAAWHAESRSPSRTVDPAALPQPAVPKLWENVAELTSQVLVEKVVERNPSLAAMQAAWRGAVERYPQVTALEDPQFSYGLAPETIGNDRLNLGQKFDLSQKIPWPGKLRTRGEMVLSEAQAAGEDAEAVRLGLIEAAHEAFFDYYYVARAIEINDVNKSLLAEFQRIAQTHYGAGLASKQDALQAEIAHESLVHRGIVLERMRRVAAARINTLLDLPAESPLPPPPPKVPDPAPIPPIERLDARAMKERPELRSLELKVEAREADVRLARLEYFPNLTVMGTYNSLWQESELRPLFGVGINVPIELERRRAALDEARAQVQHAKALLEEQRAKISFEVSRATDELTENSHVVHLYQASIIPASEESLAAARSGYEAARNDFLTLIDSEKALMLAQLAYQEGLAEYHKARARLERAVGLAPNGLEELR